MLSVVCPVYNEAANVERLFDRLRTDLSINIEVLVVYDRDEDTTVPIVRRLASLYPYEIRLVKNRFGYGALNAIRTGFHESRYEAVLVVMADLSDDLTVADQMYRLVVDTGCDVVCGSRYMQGGKQIGGPRLKGLFSRLAGLSLYHFAGVPTHDVTNSFKMYRRDFLQSVEIESDGGFEIGMELLVKAFVNEGKIAEVPSTWTDRVAGRSRFRMWKWLPKYLRWYFYAFKKRRGRLGQSPAGQNIPSP